MATYTKTVVEIAAELTLCTPPSPSCGWSRARCTDGAAEGATFCCSSEPLTSTVVAARPPCSPRQCVSLCVYVIVYVCMQCVSVCLSVYVCFVFFNVSDTMVISPVLCLPLGEIQDRAHIATDTHLVSVKLTVQLQRCSYCLDSFN